MSLRRGRRRSVTVRWRAAGLVVCAILAMALAGCALSADRQLRDQLRDRVQSAQDDLWPLRNDLARHPEETISGLSSFADARDGQPHEAHAYTLLDLDVQPDQSSLTLMVGTTVQTGGGWTYKQQPAATCFILIFPVAEEKITTRPYACPVESATEEHITIVPFEELGARDRVTPTDFPRYCHCYSGGSCDCPGG